MRLLLVSCLAENHRHLYQAVADHLSADLGIPIDFDNSAPWQERQRMLAEGQAQLGFLCGLPYVQQRQLDNPPLRLLAAPVLKSPRYGSRPIYFSDVVVRSDSPYRTWADLRGARWAYNEPQSQSGFGVVESYLARQGENWDYFGSVRASGSHANSLAWVGAQEVDATALDSAVWEMELANQPGMAEAFRVVEVLGPSPIQPLVHHRSLAQDLQKALRESLLRLRLDSPTISHFVAVHDSDYKTKWRGDRLDLHAIEGP
jgi:phosphonate transport system substrate-binding protein